jgi:hypothetical protein
MPGIYINDGGQTSSTIGSMLGNLATSLSPEAAAQAQLLREQTIGADLANQLKQATVQGISGLPGLTGAANADPTANQGSGVANVLAGAAVPPGPAPGTFGATNITAGFSPYNKVLAGSYAADPGMANVATGINLGKDITTGPGSDFPTSNAIVSAQSTPQHIAAGDTLLINPKLGANAPGNVVVGADPNALSVDKTQRNLDITDANKRADLAQGASQQIAENNRLLNIYNTLVNTPGSSDTAGILGDQIFKDLATFPLIGDVGKLSTRMGAMEAIQARLGNSITNQLKTVQGPNDVPVRGALQTIVPPNPATLDPESFRAAMEQYQRVLKYQQDEGGIAETYRNSNYGKADGDAYRAAIKAHSDAVFKADNTPPPPAETPPPPVKTKPVFTPVPDLATGEKLGPGTFFSLPDGTRHKN